jgi:hypothetical protein
MVSMCFWKWSWAPVSPNPWATRAATTGGDTRGRSHPSPPRLSAEPNAGTTRWTAVKATAGPSSPSARGAAIPNTAVGALFGRWPCSAPHQIRWPRGRIHGLWSPVTQPWARMSPDAAPRRTRCPSHRDPDVLSIDLARAQFHIGSSLGLRLELKTSAASAHPTLLGSSFPTAGAAVLVLHSTEDNTHEYGWRGALLYARRWLPVHTGALLL